MNFETKKLLVISKTEGMTKLKFVIVWQDEADNNFAWFLGTSTGSTLG